METSCVVKAGESDKNSVGPVALPQSHAWTALGRADEFDAGGFESLFYFYQS